MSERMLHVGIVGAGLGGLAAAIGITLAGHKVTILERFAKLEEVGAGIQIPPNSSRILRAYGVLEKLEAVSVRPQDIILRSYRDGRELSKADLGRPVEAKYGNPYLLIHRADCHRILVEQAKSLGVDILLGHTVCGIDFNPTFVHNNTTVVHIKGRPDFSCDLVLGADGLNSACREILLSHTSVPRPTGDMAYRIVISTQAMLADVDLRTLVNKPNINIWMGPNSHVVCYLLQQESLCNIVLLCPDTVPHGSNIATADLEEMRIFFTGWDPRLTKLLKLVEETSKWRLLNSEEMEFWCHESGRFALLGDACHATLPYLAQGAAQAIEDGAVLGTLLGRLERPDQVPDVLHLYEQLRKSRTTRIVKGSSALRYIFHMPDGDRQQDRDRQLLDAAPFEGHPNSWADPVFQAWLFDYDAFAEADLMWNRYKKGLIPSLGGRQTPSL